MRFVANYEVPFGCREQLGLQVVRPRRHVEANDQPASFDEWITRDGGLDLVPSQCIESEAEFLCQLVLPLLDEIAGRHDQAAFQVAADQQHPFALCRHRGGQVQGYRGLARSPLLVDDRKDHGPSFCL